MPRIFFIKRDFVGNILPVSEFLIILVTWDFLWRGFLVEQEILNLPRAKFPRVPGLCLDLCSRPFHLWLLILDIIVIMRKIVRMFVFPSRPTLLRSNFWVTYLSTKFVASWLYWAIRLKVQFHGSYYLFWNRNTSFVSIIGFFTTCVDSLHCWGELR